MNEPIRWVNDRRRLTLRTVDGELYAVGETVSYCDAPTVTIRDDNGQLISWRADLAQPAEDDPSLDPIGTVRCSHAPAYLAVTKPGVAKRRWIEIGTGNRLADSEVGEVPVAPRSVLERFLPPEAEETHEPAADAFKDGDDVLLNGYPVKLLSIVDNGDGPIGLVMASNYETRAVRLSELKPVRRGGVDT